VQLSECFIHPVKSCASIAVGGLDIEARGPAHDRRYMVVDGDGRFLTGRKLPRMVLIRAEPDGGGLRVQAPGMPGLAIAAPSDDATRIMVKVWGDEVAALSVAADAAGWLSAFLETHVRLVYMDGAAHRRVDPDHGEVGDEVSFADGYPLLLIGQASLDQLNDRLAVPLPITRFRPNLVVAGAAPHAEDAWRRIRIGAIRFDVVKPCTRCVFTTVDPATGTFDTRGEPLATLKTYRRGERGITFGVNLIARDHGRVRVGDPLEVIE
jgi:uncharacterized protein